jgi:acyl carrier protein
MADKVDSTEEKVINFVVRERATKRAKVSSSSRLQYDLGLDGDDAVEFFRSFEKEFSVDLQSLWSETGLRLNFRWNSERQVNSTNCQTGRKKTSFRKSNFQGGTD